MSLQGQLRAARRAFQGQGAADAVARAGNRHHFSA